MMDGLLSHSTEKEYANVACSVICYPPMSLSLWLSHLHSLVLTSGGGSMLTVTFAPIHPQVMERMTTRVAHVQTIFSCSVWPCFDLHVGVDMAWQLAGRRHRPRGRWISSTPVRNPEPVVQLC